jgi:hypothetical protein
VVTTQCMPCNDARLLSAVCKAFHSNSWKSDVLILPNLCQGLTEGLEGPCTQLCAGCAVLWFALMIYSTDVLRVTRLCCAALCCAASGLLKQPTKVSWGRPCSYRLDLLPGWMA